MVAVIKHPIIHEFGLGGNVAGSSSVELLGGKGAGLAEMSVLGLPVPPGFTITTEVCNHLSDLIATEKMYDADTFFQQVFNKVNEADAKLTQTFGFAPLVSVRSGAPISMPGMMDTILNVGMTQDTLTAWSKRIGVRATWDSYRRLIQMLGATAYGVPASKFEYQLERIKIDAEVKDDKDLDVSSLQILTGRYLHVFKDHAGWDFPNERGAQLVAAVRAVFNSWNNPRAVAYRKMNNIPDSMGTACTVQAMVFGNTGPISGTGVAFTRNPSTGSSFVMGEFLIDAQGEDVVAGIRTPLPLEAMADKEIMGKEEETWSVLHGELYEIMTKLETNYRDMMDIEFTVDRGKLWILQCRIGKRSALAAFKIARQFQDLFNIEHTEIFKRLTKEQFKLVRQPIVDPSFKTKPALEGNGASPGVATGIVVFSAHDAINCTEPCILVTKETNPDDIEGMAKAKGILTATGGSTCHAAVVARAMNKPCVVGCTDLKFADELSHAGQPAIAYGQNFNFKKGDKITIDGLSGKVWLGLDVPLVDGSDDEDVKLMMSRAVQACGVEATLQPNERPSIYGRGRYVAAEWWGSKDALDVMVQNLFDSDWFKSGSKHPVTIDLTPPTALGLKEDLILLQAFGAPSPLDYQLTDWEHTAFDYIANIQGLKLTLVMPTATIAERNRIKDNGWFLAGPAKTVADLLFNDAVSLPPGFIDDVIGGQAAMDALVAMIEKVQGKKSFSALSQAVPLEYAMFTMLAKAAKH